MLQPAYLSRNQPPIQQTVDLTQVTMSTMSTMSTPPNPIDVNTTGPPIIIAPTSAASTTTMTVTATATSAVTAVVQTPPGGVQELHQESIWWGHILKGTHSFL